MLVQHSQRKTVEESHQDSSSVVQVSDSIKYKQPKKKTICEHVNIRSIFLYICFIDSRMLCTIVNKKYILYLRN